MVPVCYQTDNCITVAVRAMHMGFDWKEVVALQDAFLKELGKGNELMAAE